VGATNRRSDLPSPMYARGRGPLIPSYELSSNDFWLVSPAEITTALDVLAFVPEADERFAMGPADSRFGGRAAPLSPLGCGRLGSMPISENREQQGGA
jgi:hypothetical protein